MPEMNERRMTAGVCVCVPRARKGRGEGGVIERAKAREPRGSKQPRAAEIHSEFNSTTRREEGAGRGDGGKTPGPRSDPGKGKGRGQDEREERKTEGLSRATVTGRTNGNREE